MERDDDLVQRITETVLAKLNQESDMRIDPASTRESVELHTKQAADAQNSVIILLCGGDMELDEVYRQISIIASRYSNVYVVMTKSANKIIGVPKIRNASRGASIITEYSQEFHEDVLPYADALYVPVLSLNTAAKVAALNADSLGTADER